MQQSSVTIKGQVTIPASIRRKLGLRRGDKVIFMEEDNKIYLQPMQDKVEAAFGLITPSKSATLEDMDEAVKKRAGRC
ncbi:MAG: AbrB/MazE/SpoVT family DNA-binding domain-containing protein [Candidatus Polarisedimenticolaceae bacterium]|nr:AbrB/MazE/SpoVT family DNA-binding domain-containing protein [Candidatus Polarisedimenticolaceae bacterium]